MDGFELLLPLELWTLIFSFASAESVGKIIPQVNKQFNKLSNNEDLWKTKCRLKNMDYSTKLPSESFKKMYFCNGLDLFPLFGIEMGITTSKELIEFEGSVKDQEMDFVTIRGVNFWFNGPKPVLHMMYLVKGLYKMPEEWIAKGFIYERSWYNNLIFLRRRFKNCQITQEPHQKPFVDRGDCFFGTMQCMDKHKTKIYCIVFTYAYSAGDERSNSTMYSISIRRGFNEAEEQNYTKLYETNAVTPAEYVIPEDVLRDYKE